MDNSKYEDLLKKYDLPDIQDQVTVTSEETIHSLRQKVFARIDVLLKLVEELLYPEGNMGAMMESSYLNEQDKKELYALFKELNQHMREAQYIGVTRDDQLAVEYVKDMHAKLPDISQRLSGIVKKTQEFWQTTPEAEKTGYFG